MNHQVKPGNFSMGLLLISLSLSTFSCSTLTYLQRQSGMRTKTIRLKDLGPQYLKHKDSDFNFFHKEAEQRLIIKYRSFKLRKYDDFNKRANVLFAKFKLAQRVNSDFDKQINRLLKKGLKGETRRSLRAALRSRSVKRLKTVQRLEKSYEALGISLSSLKDIVVDAKSLVSASKKLVKKTKKEVMSKPDKAVLADKITIESKRTLERLYQVITESPGLIKAMMSNLNILKIAKSAKNSD